MPAGREATRCRHAIELGAALRTPTVLLCSKAADPRTAAAVAEDVPGADCTVVDLREPHGDLPAFLTSEFYEAVLGSREDLPLKRNLGLALARFAGWRTLLFLDDDIEQPDPALVHAVAGALEHHEVVGVRATEFPDNSVVCHARRLGGGRQGVFVSGSALAVRADLADALFPETYNEDWLFLAPALERRQVTALGRVRQTTFNPFRLRLRAAAEEFGDVLGEGLIGALHRGSLGAARTPAYWRHFLGLRARFIAEAHERCLASSDPRAAAALPALAAAEHVRAHLSADVLSDWVAAWNTDLRVWRRYLSHIVPVGDLPAALKRLELPARSVRSGPALDAR